MAQLKDTTIQGNLNASNIDTEILSVNNITVVDYVIEQGVSGVWKYRKWSSGRMELWAKIVGTSVSVSNTWGSVYTYDHAIAAQNYPFAFAENPVVVMTPETEGSNFWLFTGSNGTTTMSPSVSIARPTSVSVKPVINFYVMGRYS